MTIGDAARAEAQREEIERVWVGLLEVRHARLEEPLRVTTDSVETVSDGHTYHPYPMELVPPDERDGQATRAQLRIAAVDRRIVRAMREITGDPAEVDIRIVLADQPDVIEEAFTLQLRRARADAGFVVAEMGEDPVLDRAWPQDSFDPSLYPGLF